MDNGYEIRMMRRGVVAGLAIAVVGGLAIGGYEAFFRRGVVVPLRVVGSSMAPTLLGRHFEVACPACGRRFTLDAEPLAPGMPASGATSTAGGRTAADGVTAEAMPYADAVRCGGCGGRVTGLADRRRVTVRPGQRVILDRTAFRTDGPRRFEIVAIVQPVAANVSVADGAEEMEKLCVKRVVGLPGERIRFVDGRLYVDEREYTLTPDERRRMPRIAVPRVPLVADRGVTDELEYLRSHGPRVACDVVPVPPGSLWPDSMDSGSGDCSPDGSSKGGGRFRELVFREPPGWRRSCGFREPVLLGDKEYFVVGDNMAISEDSRQWGPVHRSALRGRVTPYR